MVRLIDHMRHHVSVQYVRPSETPSADVTLMPSVFRVRYHVFRQIMALLEGLLAEQTTKRFLASVHSRVPFQIAQFPELFRAHFAPINPHLRVINLHKHVHRLVLLELVSRTEALLAHFALKRRFSVVLANVHDQPLKGSERATAPPACVRTAARMLRAVTTEKAPVVKDSATDFAHNGLVAGGMLWSIVDDRRTDFQT